METTTTTYTPYQVHKFLNKVLEEKGLKVVVPQMMYNYVRQGLIKTVVVDGQKRVTQEVMDTFINKFVNRRLENVNQG